MSASCSSGVGEMKSAGNGRPLSMRCAMRSTSDVANRSSRPRAISYAASRLGRTATRRAAVGNPNGSASYTTTLAHACSSLNSVASSTPHVGDRHQRVLAAELAGVEGLGERDRREFADRELRADHERDARGVEVVGDAATWCRQRTLRCTVARRQRDDARKVPFATDRRARASASSPPVTTRSPSRQAVARRPAHLDLGPVGEHVDVGEAFRSWRCHASRRALPAR